MVNLATIIAFLKRKETTSAPEAERIIPLPPLPSLPLETSRTTSPEAANRAGEALKVLKLERQILGSAVTTIYESQTKGLISQAERDQLLQKYKVDLKRLEKELDENQRVVDLFDLESAREELIRNFKTKLAEIDAKVKDLKSGASPPTGAAERKEEKGKAAEGEERKDRPSQKQQAKKPSDEQEQQISDAEKRIEQIREEILKAMDRLEQIEAEG